MHDTLALLKTARESRAEGERLWLLHVARTWGSSPRPAGSLMLLTESGRHMGSVSGGCVEGDLFERLERGELSLKQPTLIEYSADSNTQIRLPCRSRLQLVVEPITDGDSLTPLIEAIERRRPILRRLDVTSGEVQTGPADEAVLSFDGRSLMEIYGPQWRALLIGANDLARHVASQCLALGYEVIVCDPREEYRGQWSLAETVLVDAMPDDAVEQWLVDDKGALLALTHDPRLDDMALLQALQGPAFYVGALGSRRSAKRRRETLAQMGVTARQLERLDAPIGIDIGSHTPAEIAVSIAARLVQVRSQRHEGRTDLKAVEAR